MPIGKMIKFVESGSRLSRISYRHSTISCGYRDPAAPPVACHRNLLRFSLFPLPQESVSDSLAHVCMWTMQLTGLLITC